MTEASTSAEILDLVHGLVPRVTPSMAYALGQFLNALVMVLLPLLYGAMILTVILLTVSWFTSAAHLVTRRFSPAALLLYIAPGFVSLAVVIFMIKPFFAPREKTTPPRKLARREQPLLYAYVDKLCDLLGAPHPQWIEVDLSVNAAAASARGPVSAARGQMRLRVGLPLIAGASLHQLTGIIAHELGHFTQRSEMIFGPLVRSINHWFLRAIYQRDGFDQWLDDRGGRKLSPIALIANIARLCIWLDRQILRGLLYIGHLTCCFTLRQAEYDADQYQIRIQGSEGFITTHHTIGMLSIAEGNALDLVQSAWESGKLGDNLPRLIVARAGDIPPDSREKLIRMMHAQETGRFDTHPCTADRVRAARRLNYPGILHDERPSEVLFADFDGICREYTTDFLREVLGDSFDRRLLVSHNVLLEEARHEAAALKILRRFHGREVLSNRLIIPETGAVTTTDDAPAMVERHAAARKAALASKPLDDARLERRETLRMKILLATSLMPVARSGEPVTRKELGLFQATAEELAVALKRYWIEFEQLDSDRAASDGPCRQRLAAALSVLGSDAIDLRMESGERRALQSRVAALLQVADAFQASRGGIDKLNLHVRVLMTMQRLDKQSSRPRSDLSQACRTICKEAKDIVSSLRDRLASLNHPYETNEIGVSLAARLISKLPDPNAEQAAVDVIWKLLKAMEALELRIAGELAGIAETIETRLDGLSPLEDEPTDSVVAFDGIAQKADTSLDDLSLLPPLPPDTADDLNGLAHAADTSLDDISPLDGVTLSETVNPHGSAEPLDMTPDLSSMSQKEIDEIDEMLAETKADTVAPRRAAAGSYQTRSAMAQAGSAVALVVILGAMLLKVLGFYARMSHRSQPDPITINMPTPGRGPAWDEIDKEIKRLHEQNRKFMQESSERTKNITADTRDVFDEMDRQREVREQRQRELREREMQRRIIQAEQEAQSRKERAEQEGAYLRQLLQQDISAHRHFRNAAPKTLSQPPVVVPRPQVDSQDVARMSDLLPPSSATPPPAEALPVEK